MSFLPNCPPVIYSNNKNITNYRTNNPGSLGTTVSIYSNKLKYPVGKKMYFANLSLNAYGTVQGTNGGSKKSIKNTF
jgi:hypothetical protein